MIRLLVLLPLIFIVHRCVEVDQRLTNPCGWSIAQEVGPCQG
jgi:hypothetical protein